MNADIIICRSAREPLAPGAQVGQECAICEEGVVVLNRPFEGPRLRFGRRREAMPLETVEDIIEQLADWIGVYGAHNDEDPCACADEPCRVCWTSELRDRLDAAFRLEAQLESGLRAGKAEQE